MKNSSKTPIVADESFLIPILRNPGYKSLAYAAAEIFDNAIDAGAKQILAIVGNSAANIVTEIGFLDNGLGMTQPKLESCLQIGGRSDHALPQAKGRRGKYGYGLPGATFGFTDAVEVYSWQKPGEIYVVKLSLEKLAEGIPTATKVDKLPELYEKFRQKSVSAEFYGKKILDGANFLEHGTLVIWRGCERVRPRNPKIIVQRYLEPEIGRMFRHFLTDDAWSRKRWNKCSIFLGLCKKTGALEDLRQISPNDPLYLMSDHRLATKGVNFLPYETVRHKHGEAEFNLNGSKVIMRVSLAPKEVRMQYQGRGTINDEVGKNSGISVLREGRELELESFSYYKFDQRHRWWGIEIHFDRSADEFFGVPANKQYASRLREVRESDEVDGGSYPENCSVEDLPIWLALERKFDLQALTGEMLRKVRSHAEGEHDEEGDDGDSSGPDDLPDDPTDPGGNNTSGTPSEREAKRSESIKNIIEELKTIGIDNPTEEQINRFMKNQVVVSYVPQGRASGFMDVTLKPGVCHLKINTQSTFYEIVLNELKERRAEPGIEEIYHGFITVLVAYARCMDSNKTYENYKEFPRVLLKWSTRVEELLREDFDDLL